ncbi:hypothetical protein [Oceanicella actignis]|uniref:Uncharacterized membrane protein n=1 Tax=Oceanicella actignis TaxID=1189325 RepID=A0A1M7SS39_9RHOB|nr:hypothetical protein [Oceanicella actignis]SES68739.1 Uncharacterized membrane protein [Oceanicella actignis]SHN61383.1 Uncharacterized membrane protein [Oceanicella actignis]
MTAGIDFAPLLPPAAVAALGALMLLGALLAAARGAPGWPLRAAAALALTAALANPSLKRERRDPLPDVALVIVDESASNRIEDRAAQTRAAERALTEALARLGADPDRPLETRVTHVRDAGADGTRLAEALRAAAAPVAPDRIAGALIVTDGRAHDADAAPADFPAPVHVLLTGRPDEWDRRLTLTAAPAFGIVGEEVEVSFRVEALGAAPPEAREPAEVELRIDGARAAALRAPVGREVTLRLPVRHGGANVAELTLAPLAGELTARNNAALFSVNGVRDRLRVLLVSGEPHPGERTWRNLLKADPSVDLVHFTILRPPGKQSGAPVFELSLIAFPTRELFMEKIDDFDLIVFDRYRRRGVLPDAYLENVARYVREGGAVLIASGPAFAGAQSLYRTPLRAILPGRPTARVIEGGFVPRVTPQGARHPVTAGLAPPPPADPGWGRWFRQIDLEPVSGRALMTGAAERPLLLLDRVGEGRVALLASDHAWLWDRGFEGGGPQAELLRRLAHWLMKEPELEEDALWAKVSGANVEVFVRAVDRAPTEATATSPSGATRRLTLREEAPGLHVARFEADEQGLWRLSDGVREGLAAVGPPSPREFADAVSSAAPLAPLARATRGGVVRLADGMPALRRVREGRDAAGRGWLGLAMREAHAVREVSLISLAPGWLALLLVAGLIAAAWRREAR